ncbi:MAG: hypothetical protein ABJN26_21695 [Stappiaceae bacterium]
MAEEGKKTGSQKRGRSEREKRLAQALRSNLKRRKTQIRQRRETKDQNADKAD